MGASHGTAQEAAARSAPPMPAVRTIAGRESTVPYSRAMAVGEREVSRTSAERAQVQTPSVRARSRGQRIRVAVAGATGYAGGEVVRLLARHGDVELVGLTGRGREGDP